MIQPKGKTGRKPADQVAAAPKPQGRQAAWDAMRRLTAARGIFTGRDAVLESDVNRHTLHTYLTGLQAAGFVELVAHADGGSAAIYRVTTDQVEAPRVRKDGAAVTQGVATDHMWRAMKMLKAFTPGDLALAASTEKVTVTVAAAKAYCHHLYVAGYLAQVQPVKAAKRQARYRLHAHRNTGPKAPMVQRVKRVFDPNLGRVMWTGEPGETAP